MPRSPEQQRIDRAARYEKYRQYRELCQERGVTAKTCRWCEHWDELLAGHMRRPSRAELHGWWRERFSLAEISAMAGALESLLSEDEGRREVWA